MTLSKRKKKESSNQSSRAMDIHVIQTQKILEKVINPIETKGKRAVNDEDYEEGDDLILDYDMTQFIKKVK